jgi:DNA repair photolyase
MNKLYNNPLSITSQFSFCGLPFRLDTYSGCAFSCTYCFARLRGGKIITNMVRASSPELIIEKFKKSLKSEISDDRGIISEYISNRMTVHFGGMSDPFQPIEKKKKISLKVLEYLCSIEYPIVISTKSDLLSTEPYLNILKSNPRLLVQFSFSTTINKIAEITEPHSTPPSRLLKTIEKLSKENVKTAIRWQPFIPNVSEEPINFIPTVSNLGIKHLGFEHLKLPFEKNNPLFQQLIAKSNFDLREFFKKNECINEGREYILPPKYKIENIKKVKLELSKYNITFGVADNELQYLSDTNCCCSGVDQFPEFSSWNKFQIAYAIKKSNFEEITFDLIENEWKPNGTIDNQLNSHSRIEKKEGRHNTVNDYILERWENLNSSFNPTKFYGVVDSGRRDIKGRRIFSWNKVNL